MEAQPDLFAGWDFAQVTGLIENFKTATNTWTEAFDLFVAQVEDVAVAMAVLEAYADSNLAEQYDEMLQATFATLTDNVNSMYDDLSDAIVNFDGSPEQLQRIGQLAWETRQAELQLLAQIDGIAAGLTSRMQNLKQYVDGILNPAKEMTAEQAVRQAQSYLDALRLATSPEEVARIGEEFDAFIRSLTPEQIQKYGLDYQYLINTFDETQSRMLQEMRDQALANAEAAQAWVNDFLDRIGGTLDIIANYMSDDVATQQATVIADGINQTMVDNNEDMKNIMRDGLKDIGGGVRSIGPIADLAIRQGFAGANVTVIVRTPDGGLVTQ